jgi:uncharacterized RDD family membrane protein YckC
MDQSGWIDSSGYTTDISVSASLGRRAAARLLDTAILAAPFLWLAISGGFHQGAAETYGLLALAPLMHLAYYLGYWLGRGQTPGEFLMAICMIHEAGSSIPFRMALECYLGAPVRYGVKRR